MSKCPECRYYETCKKNLSEFLETGCDKYIAKRVKRTTLCWSCGKLDCSWMRNLEPVAGWEAIKTDVGHTTPQGYVHLPSYCVLSCPGYVEVENNNKKMSK
ncbi:MAG: hypothetical protein NC548_52700 [Lachnospiraceae bacterium]|nr:hypothetical protein [Lachnospiraceae bacterium]